MCVTFRSVKGVVLAAVLAACSADPVIHSPPLSVPDARGTYLKDTPALLASPELRARLEQLVRSHRITTVVPYALGSLAGTQQLSTWIDEIHRAGGRVVVPIAGTDRLFALANGRLWVDGFVSELEYWNKPDRPLDDLLALVTAMRGWNNHGHPFEVGVYLGSPTAEEAGRIAKAVDFVFLDYSVSSPEKAWSPKLRARLDLFAGVAVWPIFYATGEVDMRASLVSGLERAEQQFRTQARVAGFVYFTFEATPW